MPSHRPPERQTPAQKGLSSYLLVYALGLQSPEQASLHFVPICVQHPPRLPASTAVLAQPTSHPSRATNLHTRLLLLRLRLLRIDDPLLDVAREAEEGFLDIDVAFCRNLHEWDPELVG